MYPLRCSFPSVRRSLLCTTVVSRKHPQRAAPGARSQVTMPSRDGHPDPFADGSPSPGRPYSPQSSPAPSNPLAYQQVGQGSSPNLTPSPGTNEARGSRYAPSPLNPKPTPSPSRSGTRPTSPESSSGHVRGTDRSLSQNSSDGSAEKDHVMRGVMAGSVGGGFTPYPVSIRLCRHLEWDS